MEKLEDIIFYTLEKAIRKYRQYAQKELKNAGYTITIDQWLITKQILENPGISQQELSEKVFKDNASVTRMIELLSKANYLTRQIDNGDRRRTNLQVTPQGIKVITDVNKIIMRNRSTALKGIGDAEVSNTQKVLNAIIANCNN